MLPANWGCSLVQLQIYLIARNVTDLVAAAWDVLNGTETQIDVLKTALDRAARKRIFLVAAGLGYVKPGIHH